MFCISCSASLKRILLLDAGVLFLDRAIAARENVDVLADVGDFEQPGLHAIVEVGREVGDLVGEVDDLRLERRPLIEKVLRQLRMLV